MDDKNAIYIRLKELKEKTGFTNSQLSTLSGVPLGTINRILSGQTDNPSYQTVQDLVIAMGSTMDDFAGLIGKSSAPEENSVNYQIMTEFYERAISQKNKWISRLFAICCVLGAVIVAMLLFDIFNGSIGFLRY